MWEAKPWTHLDGMLTLDPHVWDAKPWTHMCGVLNSGPIYEGGGQT